MKTVIIDNNVTDIKPCVATIGFFDGVHKGHKFLIDYIKGIAKDKELESTVITFDKHPRQVLKQDYMPKMLSTFDEKILLLSKTGVDNCAVLPFNNETSALSAYDFMKNVLRDRLNVKVLVMGYDNRFGHNRSDSFDDYVRYGKELGIEVIPAQAFIMNGVNVSSSVIRSYLDKGEIEMANKCLGYPYFISGKVIDGCHNGRRLGFPTANLEVDDKDKLVPAAGVYAVKARTEECLEQKRAMMNIGTRPTFEGQNTSLETYILHFKGNIYDQKLAISFFHRIRSERKFNSLEELTSQLAKDEEMVNEQFDIEHDFLEV